MECVQEIEKTKIVSVKQLQFVLLNIKFFSLKTKKSKAESSKNAGSTKEVGDDDLEAALLNKEIKNRQKCAICYSGLFVWEYGKSLFRYYIVYCVPPSL